MAFKEQVTFYADEARTLPVFSFKARQRLDLGSGYDVLDAQGNPIGSFRKDFGASLLRSTWHLEAPGLTATGSERNATVAVLRRAWNLVPVLGDLPAPFVVHFDFTEGDGRQVLTSTRKVSRGTATTSTCPAPGSTGGSPRRWPSRSTRCRVAEPASVRRERARPAPRPGGPARPGTARRAW
jgi:hypothetical protein